MNKIPFRFIISALLIILCYGLVGCDLNNNLLTDENIDLLNYNQYIKKVWVVKEWDGGDYSQFSSFFITKIENGVVEGKLSTSLVKGPNTYKNHNWSNLTGTIKNGIAKCQFCGEEGYKGNIELVFKENDVIEATIEYIEQECETDNLNGKFIFRPYNLKDNEYLIDPLKTHSFKVNLNSWGNINFTTIVTSGYKPYPQAFITDENDNILYSFAAFQVGSEIINVEVEDINGDGLKDVKMTTEAPGIFRLELVYIQMENGWFSYNDTLSNETIL